MRKLEKGVVALGIRHYLKVWPEFFNPLRTGEKRCEVRKADRNFNVGDRLVLREYDPEAKKYTGRGVCVDITHILDDERFVPEGTVILSISEVYSEWDDSKGWESCR